MALCCGVYIEEGFTRIARLPAGSNPPSVRVEWVIVVAPSSVCSGFTSPVTVMCVRALRVTRMLPVGARAGGGLRGGRHVIPYRT